MKIGLEKLLLPCKLGKLNLKNKIFMSSMNRLRADVKTGKPTNMMTTYYVQRCHAGLIFTEPLYVSLDGVTNLNCSGMWSDDFIDGWRRLVEKVHENDGVIFATLTHGGRTAHPNCNGGLRPLAPSAIRANIQVKIREKLSDAVTPREMTEDDIDRVLDQFFESAERVRKAEFDGISLQASSGSLVESFIKSNTNKRIDHWGGDGGLQFPVEILKRFRAVFDDQYIAIKINPFDNYNDMHEDHPKEKYTTLINKIHAESKIGLIELKELVEKGTDSSCQNVKITTELFEKEIRKGSYLISNFGTKKMNDAIVKMEKEVCDFVSCATFYVSNPNLPEKLKKQIPLTMPNVDDYYTQGPEGYIDYI